MKTIALIGLNLSLLGLFLFLLTRRHLLTYHHKRRLWLTFLAVAVISWMDIFGSIFYAPPEAYRFIGSSALVFIALTSLLIGFMSTRFTEIAEILEHHKIIGGGVYSFAYFVLGPTVSFVAMASIMVAYTITACISAVSAVGNAISFTAYSQSPNIKMYLALGILWFVAGLNIAGIRQNARFTFGVFILAAIIFLNLIVSGLIDFERLGAWARLHSAYATAAADLQKGSWLTHYGTFVHHIAFCILAYSGIESVIQTAGLVRNWQDIRKAYWFLILTGVVAVPLISMLALTAPFDIARHTDDLITHYATILNGHEFGMMVAALAAFTLTMTVNTAFVASSEMIERVALRYNLTWLTAVNRRHSLYRIHLMNATFFSGIMLLTSGKQDILAGMFAIGLVASFCINMGCLLIYRYRLGTVEIEYHTSRFGTLVLWIILVSCFGVLAVLRIQGTALWASVTALVLIVGLLISRRYAPEIKEEFKGDITADMIAYLLESRERTVHLFFRRGREPKHGMDERAPGLESLEPGISAWNSVYITFYSPRAGAPPKAHPNHFRFSLSKHTFFQEMVYLLRLIETEFPDRHVVVHIGWPLSSWFDRLSMGVMYLKLIRLPWMFPAFGFIMRYTTRVSLPFRRLKPQRPAQDNPETNRGRP
ncbi:MAG: APC family permease [Desulfobaccales bacterium]